MEIRRLRAELFHEDRQYRHDEANGRFSQLGDFVRKWAKIVLKYA